LFLKQDRKCKLSGIEIKFHPEEKRIKQSQQTASLDRIDNTKGYIEGNIQWLHKDINNMKWNFNESTFINYCCQIARNYNKEIS
jgi:hypothetical protein